MSGDESPLFRRGYAARMSAIESTACPWSSGPEGASFDRLLSSEHSGDPPWPKCPWCAGWIAAERELYEAAKRGKR